jgi:hypothetical protein
LVAATRDIRTNQADISCDVCGRTLLRGERAEAYLAGGARRQVCDLCTLRAQHEGWIRESGADAQAPRNARHERRRSWRDRLRERRERAEEVRAARATEAAAAAAAERDQAERAAAERAAVQRAHAELEAAGYPLPGDAAPERERELDLEVEPEREAASEPPAEERAPPRRRRRRRERPSDAADAERDAPREPRHVRAVPTNADLKMQRALEVFNASDAVRTVGGVSRSLGAPAVRVRPLAERPSVVAITVMWELSWYRYEIDLSDEAGGVRREAQGAELAELTEEERAVNAAADERGALHLAAAAT